MTSLARTTKLASRPRNAGSFPEPTVQPDKELNDTLIESNSSENSEPVANQVLNSATALTKETLDGQYLPFRPPATENSIEIGATEEAVEVEDTDESSHSKATIEDVQVKDDEDFFTEVELRDAAIRTAREKYKTNPFMGCATAPQIIPSSDPAGSEAVVNTVAVVQAYAFLTSLDKSMLTNLAHDLESGASEIAIDKNGDPKVVPTFAREDLFRYFGIRAVRLQQLQDFGNKLYR